MARSTGPLLASGAIIIGNNVIVHGQPMDWKKPLQFGVLAVVFAGAEHIPGAEFFVAGIAWIVVVGVVLTRTNPNVPSPAEAFAKWAGL